MTMPETQRRVGNVDRERISRLLNPEVYKDPCITEGTDKDLTIRKGGT